LELLAFLTEAISMKNAREFPAWASRVLSLDEHARLELEVRSLGSARIGIHKTVQSCIEEAGRKVISFCFKLFQGLPSWLPLQLWQRAHA